LSSDELLGPLSSSPAVLAAVSDEAWLRAMLEVEGALAQAQADVGIVPADAAEAIARVCAGLVLDPAQVGAESVDVGNPAAPLVRRLTAAVPLDAAGWVHWGATSQDVVDSGLALVTRRAVDLLLADLDEATRACARLADQYRQTVMPGRTLMQQALPTTFGLKAAGWLTALDEAYDALAAAATRSCAAQLGGAAGTLASLGDQGVEVLERFAARLGLAEPVLPWHTARGRVAQLGAALAVAAGAAGKVALDVVLLASTEVGEVTEAAGRGGSSTLPHKRNPVGAVTVSACARRVTALAPVLLGAMAQEHERAAGAWQAEWDTLRDALRLTGGALSGVRDLLSGLDVHPERMRANLDRTGGLLLTEHVMMVLAERIGRQAAHDLVEAVVRRVERASGDLRTALLADPAVAAHLGPTALDAALDPAGYLGSADRFVGRALAAHRRALTRRPAPEV
jgi:3-carboxy-cis,cis-muconate cycloisomerase